MLNLFVRHGLILPRMLNRLSYFDQMRQLARARAQSAALVGDLRQDIQSGILIAPNQAATVQAIRAGGVNQCPNSDFSYSKLAATVPGTLPSTAGDTNYECWQVFRQQVGASINVAAAGALKSSAHSLFAANEGTTPGLPRWDRVNGWCVIGAQGATQYDIAIQLPSLVLNASQKWYCRLRMAALTPNLVPATLELSAGFWQKTGAGEGWIGGTNFTLDAQVIGLPGTQSIDYRVLAKTDSGLSILSAVKTVANAPNALSTDNFVRLGFSAVAGFIEFQIFRKQSSNYYHVYTIRNDTQLSFDDVGTAQGPVAGWPAVSQTQPLALAQTRNIRIGAFGQMWQPNDLTIVVPPTYDVTQTTAFGQFLRIGLSQAAAVDQQIGIDQIMLATTYNEWSPDPPIRFSDGTFALPSISPTSSYQGGGEGVTDPPPRGSGGGGHFGDFGL